jgi:hypothetical protein
LAQIDRLRFEEQTLSGRLTAKIPAKIKRDANGAYGEQRLLQNRKYSA